MHRTKPLQYHHPSPIINSIITLMIKDTPFPQPLPHSLSTNPFNSPTLITTLLRSIPTFFFHSPTSIGNQISNPSRHRAPLKQKNPTDPTLKNPERVFFGVAKTAQFLKWAEAHHGFTHTEMTVKEFGVLLIKANMVNDLWVFLKSVEKGVLTVMSMTCLVKCLGEEGYVNEAMQCFYRMRQFHCKADVFAYNNMINVLCKVGFFKKAKDLLRKMELPGFRCPPDVYTYTILISAYCRFSMQTGCRKAVRRRMWEANHLFRLMLWRGFTPDLVCYNSLIDGCCKTYRIERALELFEDMKKRGCVPNRVTYDSFIRYYSVVNEVDKGIEMLRMMEEMGHGMATTSSYTPVIHTLCQVGRAVEAWGLLVELVNRGITPREYTYTFVCDALRSEGKADVVDEEIRRKIEDGIVSRFKRKMKVKPIMSRKNCALVIEGDALVQQDLKYS